MKVALSVHAYSTRPATNQHVPTTAKAAISATKVAMVPSVWAQDHTVSVRSAMVSRAVATVLVARVVTSSVREAISPTTAKAATSVMKAAISSAKVVISVRAVMVSSVAAIANIRAAITLMASIA